MEVSMNKKFYNLLGSSQFVFSIKTTNVTFNLESRLLIRFPVYYTPYLGENLNI